MSKTYTTAEAMEKLNVLTPNTLDKLSFLSGKMPKKTRVGKTRLFINIYTDSDLQAMALFRDPRHTGIKRAKGK